ncbi:MAG: 16S rRNA (adenine(1518)-N(6)/adenine(1519)-N(6))-dimethyltransferase RsmA [Gemmatimonadales bacterium]
MKATKRLGQHFLTDPAILSRIVEALAPTPSDMVLEIGPGEGSLTAALLPRVGKVIAIEKDRRLVDQLRAQCAVSGAPGDLTVIEGDALKLDWHRLPAYGARRTAHAFKVVGNIPYNITSPLLEKALTPPLPSRIVFLVQAEVAERIAAPPGGKTYGALSVGVQATCRVEQLFTIAPGAFRPPPKVRSALLRLTPLAEPLVGPDEVAPLRAFVTACFSRRRKQLRNVVAGATGQPAAAVVAGLAALGLDPAARPETLPPTAFVRLLRWSQQL